MSQPMLNLFVSIHRTLCRNVGLLCMVLLVIWPVHSQAQESANLLVNSDFSAVENGWPTGWTIRNNEQLVSIVDDADGGKILRVQVTQVAGPNLGQIGQIVTLLPNTRYQLRGRIKSSTQGAALIMIKRVKDKIEQSRISSYPSTQQWNPIVLDFNSGDADQVQILCRFGQLQSDVGSVSWFDDLSLHAMVIPEPDELETRPTFNSCSYYWNLPDDINGGQQIGVQFRAQGQAAWQRAMAPFWFEKDRQFRGSIVDLHENTTYKMQVLDAQNKPILQRTFTTWNSDVPIAKTIDIRSRLHDGNIVIQDQGKPKGWICFTAPRGTIIQVDGVNNLSGAGIDIRNAAYVILKNIVIRGGQNHAVNIERSNHVRLINCDISGFGQDGQLAKDPVYYMHQGARINYQAGIRAFSNFGLVVERCYIHGPRSPSTGWRHGHPLGPTSMFVNDLSSTVIRYNDFAASDQHRWNDAIEGSGNSSDIGGFNRDADIHGNFFAFANDDGIELDGAQMNVRLFENRFEGGFCGISTSWVVRGPSYIYRNVILHGGDANRLVGTAFKDLKRSDIQGPAVFVNNTVYSQSKGFGGSQGQRLYRNNVLMAGSKAYPLFDLPHRTVDHSLFWAERGPAVREDFKRESVIVAKPKFVDANNGLFALQADMPGAMDGKSVDNLASEKLHGSYRGAIRPGLTAIWPRRPTSFKIDRGQIILDPLTDVATFELQADSTADQNIHIRQSQTTDWLDIMPENVNVPAGGRVTFKVQLRRERMAYVGNYAASFSVTDEQGMSIPVTVYSWQNGPTQPVLTVGEGSMIAYSQMRIAKPINGPVTECKSEKSMTLAENKALEAWQFDLPVEGNYYILMRVYRDDDASLKKYLKAGLVIDGQKVADIAWPQQLAGGRWEWVSCPNPTRKTPQKSEASRFGLFSLKAGQHSITLENTNGVQIDSMVLTPVFSLLSGAVNNMWPIPVAMPNH